MDNAFIGFIALNAGGVTPQGWMVCNGQLLQIVANPALYALLGSKYGGDGKKTFALPKLAGPEGTTYMIATQGMYPHA